MTKAEFNVLFERFAIPAIEEICANNSLITPKNYDISKEKVYAEYEKMRHKYKEAIFSKDDLGLLDRHKVASCICGAILKYSVIDKTHLVKKMKEEKTRCEAYFYYVNELIAFVFATKVLMSFMMKDYSSDLEMQKLIFTSFPVMPQIQCSKVGVLYSIMFNLAQINDPVQIGIEHYDIYSYAMMFFFLESYFYTKKLMDNQTWDNQTC